jgi:polyisoprenoid-binding protein YceI
MMRCHSPRRWNRRSRSYAWILAAALPLLAPAGTAQATPGCYAVDATRSRVEFRIRYFAFFSPGGRFDRVAGRVNFDPEHWDALAVSIRIDVESLESRPRFWRDELLGPRFFDHARYPGISFDGNRAEQTGPDAGRAYGALTLRGNTRPVTLRAHVAAASGALDIDAETSVLRSDFGLGGVLPLASDEVTIALQLHAIPASCDG